MSHKITDNELIDELKERFNSNQKLIEEQNTLMNQLKSLNTKLLESEQLKTNFLSNIRNEINNPLTSIIEISKNIYFSDLDLKQIKKHSELIYQEIQQLDFQLKNIFASAEIEAGESIPKSSAVNIPSLINYVLDYFKHQIKKKKLKVTVNDKFLKNQLFHTDSEKLNLILSNIISNAIMYSFEKGNIKINYHTNSDDDLIIEVTDNGIGISEENRDKIFERFNQLDKGSTKLFAGQGLGLTITKELLDLIDGTITIDSKPTMGSTFCIKLKKISNDDNNSIATSSHGNDFIFSNDTEELF